MGVRWLCGFIYDISASKSYLSCDLGRPGGGKARESAEEKEPWMSIGSMKLNSKHSWVASNYRFVYFHNVDFSMNCFFLFRFLVWISIWKLRWLGGRRVRGGVKPCPIMQQFLCSNKKQILTASEITRSANFRAGQFSSITLFFLLIPSPCHHRDFHVKPFASVIKTQFMKLYTEKTQTRFFL